MGLSISHSRFWRAAVVVAVVCVSGLGHGQDAPQAPPFEGTPQELEAYSLYNQNKLLTARTKAERIVRANPESMVAHYILGCVYREAEGSLARAMFHLGRAREIYELRWGASGGGPQHLHRETLFAIQGLAGEMEEYEYQISVLEYHDYLYDPDLLGEHAWPLMHLDRYEEARRFAQAAKSTSDAWQQSLGRNALCAIEGEAGQREAWYRACLDALENARHRVTAAQAQSQSGGDTSPETGPALAVHAYNAALAAASTLRYDEVERLSTEASQRLEFTTANPWRILVRRYIDAGRMVDAVNALREMQRWRVRQPAHLRDQDRAETDVALATVLLAAGEADTGMRAVTRAIERPDRRGLTSTTPEAALGASALLRRALARVQAERTRERASWSGTGPRIGNTFRAMGQRIASWPDDERIAGVLTDDDRLVATLRLYVHGGIEPVPTWLAGDLVDVLGAGVVAVALRQARQDERAVPALGPLYDAIEAEVALAQGDEERSLQLAQRALERLPAAEALLSARAAAIGAEAAFDLNQDALALGMLERAMQRDPGVIRRLGLALPATFRSQASGEAAERALELLERSPRFDDEDTGFGVSVEAGAPSRFGQGLRVCLRSAQGALIHCTDAQPKQREEQSDFAARLVQEFHTNAFAIRAGLSTTDLRGLDGSVTPAGEANREEMRGMLNDLATQQQEQP